MDFVSRIQQIESRISDIQSQVSDMAPPQPSGSVDFEQMLHQQMAAADGDGAMPAGTSAWVPGSTPAGCVNEAGSSSLGAGAAQFDTHIQSAASEFGVDPNLIKSVIQQESAFNPKATSGCGAQGLMQLMPATASELGCSNAYDAGQNIQAGTKYLKQLLDRFHGDTSLALAAYNAGANSVDKYGGIPPFAETQNYVKNILSNYANYKRNG